MKVLITGINGFVGSNLVKNWNKKFAISGLDIFSKPMEGVEGTYSWDQLDKIPQVDAIIHLAGKAHDTKNKSLAEDYFKINTELTKKIFDYFLQSNVKTFIFFSSVKAAADTIENDILTEEIIPKPVGPYGESKIAAENYIISQFPFNKDPETRNPRPETKNVYILRPCMIHGSGNKGNLNLLYNVVSKGIPWPLGAFDNKRSFCSIDNIAYVVEQLIIRNDIESGIYHIGDDEALSTNELIRLISESAEKKTLIWSISKKLIALLANFSGALHLPLNNERLKKLTENYVVSNSKIKKALGIDRMPVSAVEGMKKTLKSFNS